jgi:hypothetical protein
MSMTGNLARIGVVGSTEVRRTGAATGRLAFDRSWPEAALQRTPVGCDGFL